MFFAIALTATATTRITQMVFPFPTKRHYKFSYNQKENTLTLEIANTSPSELGALDHYDESLVRRVLVKDLSGQGTEVRLTLRDRNIKATVFHFEEPFRIAIDLYDAAFEQTRDKITGMPIHGGDLHSTSNMEFDSEPIAETLAKNTQEESPTESKSKRRLLQPTPELFHEPGELKEALLKIEPGLGSHWKDYPLYIYRIQTAAYQNNEKTNAWLRRNADQALSSTQAMADYASKLYDFGHENRSILAYQQVLHQNQSILEKDPLHLWKFAELHLGQGNLTLADGYFQALTLKHAEHELASFAKLRRLDIASIRSYRLAKLDQLEALGQSLQEISGVNDSEIQLQLTIRAIFWRKQSTKVYDELLADKNFLPIVGPEQYASLINNLNKAQSQRTEFLATTLILNTNLEPTNPWQIETGKIASRYLERYQGGGSEPFRSQIAKKLAEKINNSLQELVTNGKLIDAIQVYENLPKNLNEIKNRATAWALAEAYRKLGQIENSVYFYELAAKQAAPGPDFFRSYFWLAVTTGQTRHDLKSSGQNEARIALLGKKSRNADTQMEKSWGELKPDERSQLTSSYKNHFEATLDAPYLLKTPAMILLSSWSDGLSTKMSADSSDTNNSPNTFTPSGAAVLTLSKLAKRFQELGLNAERQKTVALLKFMKPSQFGDSESAKQIWANELKDLANEYRESSKYLEAGRIFAYAGGESEEWSDRAESLYKGGLLLHRAGRREEATTAFQKCSEDGNNRYYANLCSERLDRLNNQ